MKFSTMRTCGRLYAPSIIDDVNIDPIDPKLLPYGFEPKEAYGDIGWHTQWYVYSTAVMFDVVPNVPRTLAQLELRVILMNSNDDFSLHVKYVGIDTCSNHFGAIDEASDYLDQLARRIVRALNKGDIVAALAAMKFFGFIDINNCSGRIDSLLELASNMYANYFAFDAKLDPLVAEQMTVNKLRQSLTFYNGSYMKP